MDKDVADKCHATEEAAKLSSEAMERVLAAKMSVKARERHCNVAQVFDNVEDEVNQALQELKVIVGATATAKCAFSYGTEHGTENECSFLNDALTILRSETEAANVEGGACEVVATETQWKRMRNRREGIRGEKVAVDELKKLAEVSNSRS